MTDDTETIYLEAAKEGTERYFTVEARRTNHNYFEIVSESFGDNVGSFRRGDVVRCAWRYFGCGFDGGIVANSLSRCNLPIFSVGDRVIVSEHAGWSCNFIGTVSSGSEMSTNMLGQVLLYWIEFDEPQKERDEENTYIQAQISNAYLKFA